MPPAAKKKKFKQTTIAGGESKVVRDAVTKCKRSREYAETVDAVTFIAARKVNRLIGTPKWYRLNKDALVASLILHRCVLTIQKFFRMSLELKKGKTLSFNGYSNKKRKVDHDHHADNVCPISLVPMSQIPHSLRFAHTNTWFNKGVLA